MVTSLFIDGWILHKLAPQFQRAVSFDRAFSLVANASIPGFLAWTLGIIPALMHLKIFAFGYCLYLVYVGFDKMIERSATTPKNDTKPAFFSAMLALILIVHIVMHALVEPMTPSPFFDLAR
jgi:hypothetical protein